MTENTMNKRIHRRLGAGLLLALTTAACDSIIEVKLGDRVEESTLEIPEAASLLANSAQATFECAYSGYTHAMGLFADELNSMGNTVIYSYDRRDPSPAGGFVGVYADGDCNSPGLYKPLSSARWFADNVSEKLRSWSDAEVPGRMGLLASTAVYSGYSLVLLGESMCSAAIDEGPELSQSDLFALAEERFNEAVTAATSSGRADLQNFAMVGRARARLNMGNTSGATSDASQVPAGFTFSATYDGSTPTNAERRNELAYNMHYIAGTGLDPAFWNVEWQGVPDPRVASESRGLTTLGVEHVLQLKYPTITSPIPLARWAEAQLIMAEVAGGQTAVDIINALHENAGIPPFDATGLSNDQIMEHVIEERRRELFLEGHRAYDRARYGLPLYPAVGSAYRWGGVHGSATCFPLPNVERDNNPNIS